MKSLVTLSIALLGSRQAVTPPNALARRPQTNRMTAGDRAAHFIEQVRQLRQQLRCPTFLDMVPTEYRAAVIAMADSAFPTKGAGRTLEAFREDMAMNWLAQREAFESFSQELGFQSINYLATSQADGLLALTVNGSLIAVSSPAADGRRGILYGRIDEREDTNIPAANKGNLRTAAISGERLQTTIFTSSKIIGLATSPRTDLVEMQRTFIDMRHTLNTIGQTIFVPAWKGPKGRD
ncbi:MAG: hypothetical protein JW782_05460 [Candidatus Saganbacteria bacterium]|nr:hypothetical protein [Candidatus Saganbacteria bacterium]